jgi:hypothetical protein
MQRQVNCDWISEVLRDIVSFLSVNEMKEKSSILAEAAAHAGFSIGGSTVIAPIWHADVPNKTKSNVIAFKPRVSKVRSS